MANEAQSSAHKSACTVDWSEAVTDFLLQKHATREENTERSYRERLRVLVRWAQEKGIDLTNFRARDLREYLAFRTDQKISDRTRRHDASVARTFLNFCKQEQYVSGDPLTGFQVPRAGRASVKCPSDDDIRAILIACQERWIPGVSPQACHFHPTARWTFRTRNYAILAGLVETGLRIGEMLNLATYDFEVAPSILRRPGGRIIVREAKGDERRVVPVSGAYVDILRAWLKARPSIAENDLLFCTEQGEIIDRTYFAKSYKRDQKFAGIKKLYTLHSLRHYALSQIARADVVAAQMIAGHKSLAVTQSYMHTDEEQCGSRMKKPLLCLGCW